MRYTPTYEWDVEVYLDYADTDDEDIIEHHHAQRVADLLPLLREPMPDPDGLGTMKTRLVLVRDLIDEDGDVCDRGWAYVEDGHLPDDFDCGNPVPRKFFLELLEAVTPR